jgi:glycosyltransferase involved in cell wall biosynthesis
MYQISVVIPVFNKRDTLVRAIDSVLLQNMKGVEVVVVDDGSNDGSIDTLPHETAAAIRIVTQTNQGVSAARNTGVETSSAPLIAFLDADDVYYPGALALFVKLSLLYPDATYFSGAFDIVSENGVPFIPKGSWSIDKVDSVDNFAKELRLNTSLISSSSVCVRRHAFLDSGGFPIGAVLGEDIYLWLKLSIYGRFCHAGQRVARIYRDAPNRSLLTSKQSGQVHYFLTYFLLDKEGFEQYNSQHDMRRLLFILALKNLLGAKEVGDDALVSGIVNIYCCHSSWQATILMIAARLPSSFIRLVRSAKVALARF